MNDTSNITLSITWDEARLFARFSQPAFMIANRHRDFEVIVTLNGVATADEPDNSQVIADLIRKDDDFDAGSLLWTYTYLEALILMKVHRAHGHRALLLHHLCNEASIGFAVLSTEPFPFLEPEF